MKIKLFVMWQGNPAGTIVEVEKGVGDALINHRRPPAGVEVDSEGKPIEVKPKGKLKPGASEVK